MLTYAHAAGHEVMNVLFRVRPARLPHGRQITQRLSEAGIARCVKFKLVSSSVLTSHHHGTTVLNRMVNKEFPGTIFLGVAGRIYCPQGVSAGEAS